jgi:putative ATPase
VKSGRTLAVPKHLRDNHYRGAEEFGHGTDYEYSHDLPDAWSAQEYLPEARRYYEPVDRGHEAVIRQRLEELRRRRDSETQDGEGQR